MSAVASRWSALYADANAARLLELARFGLTTEPDAPGCWFYLP